MMQCNKDRILFWSAQRYLLVGMLVVTFVARLPAVAEEVAPYKSLIDNSPFLTQAFRNQLGRRDRAAIEFRGYTKVDDEWQFGILDTKSGKAYWLRLHEEEDHILVERFNRSAERLFIKVDGIAVELRLRD